MSTRVSTVALLLLAVMVMGAVSPRGAQTAQAQGQSQAATGSGAPPRSNPLRVALLRWYPANLYTRFHVGKTRNSNPYGLAFDGENIWSANSEGTVTKLRASDGTNLGTFPAGNGPTGIAYDGADMWVTNYYDGTVSKIRASDGKTLGTFAIGAQTYPGWLAFDGENIWVPNAKGLTKFRAIDGKNLGTFSLADGAFAVVNENV